MFFFLNLFLENTSEICFTLKYFNLNKKHKELQESANNDIAPFLFNKGMNNPKKVYYNFESFYVENSST